MRNKLTAVITVCILFYTGCMVGPNYKTPQTKLPNSFLITEGSDYTNDAVEIEWWRGFKDPVLDELIEAALAGNYDIQIATARVLEARALRTETGLELAPIVPFDANYTKQKVGESTVFPGVSRETDLYEAGFDATWELDFFGRIRRTLEAETAEIQSRVAARRDVIVSLLAEIARNYFELRGAQNQLEVARKNAENQQKTLELTIALLEGGRGTELDTSRARAQLNNTLAIIPPLESNVRRAIYRIGVLTGQQPDTFVNELLKPKPLPEVPMLVKIGTPIGLLERRPDIKVAERNLAGFTASIGIATADLFPRISLLGSIALQANTFSGLFEGGAGAFSIGPDIFWSAFDMGRVYQRIKAADALTQAAFAQYQLTVLTAIEEVDSALVDHKQQFVRYKYLKESAQESEKAMKLAELRYRYGVANFLDVLDAQRTLLLAQSELALSETNLNTSLVAVYKSLGGGWEVYNEKNIANAKQ